MDMEPRVLKCNLKNSKGLKEVLEYIAGAEISDTEEWNSDDDCFIDSDNELVTKGVDVSSEISDDEVSDEDDTSFLLTTKN
ncbi:hypothetical protein CEXT_584751 [Caerostris extrusa]|uniref:Uncharacterized protein n=1 Tax=Caerostris extrusa TaxID=172846 RepID=A0AAV4T4X6_CAEEX|nr:hypothetical protein CEXT_584751 [Caerostris extrusa]